MAEEDPKNQPGAGGEPQGDDASEWKAWSRKWEKQAKANKEKADAYDKLHQDDDDRRHNEGRGECGDLHDVHERKDGGENKRKMG